ncbi:MAG: glutamate synthase large subunit, partial [Bacteroidota bacterium]
ALEIPPEKVVLKGRLQPGKMLIADLDEHRIIGDEELKRVVCSRLPYREWLDEHAVSMHDLPKGKNGSIELEEETLLKKQLLFGYSREDLKFIISPMIKGKKDPIGSMGSDTPLAALSHHAQHLSNYFKQLFAQVTNPPIDPIRERNVMSLHTKLGGCKRVLAALPENAKFIQLDRPVLSNPEFSKLKYLHHPDFQSGVIDILFQADQQKGRLKAAIAHVCAVAEDLVRSGTNLVILSDRKANAVLAPIPSLLAAGAVHHHLIREGLRTQCSIIVEAGDIRETHHFATLLGYGVDAINPYIVYSTIAGLWEAEILDQRRSPYELIDDYLYAISKGLLKIMSKIGISTVLSYRGAQIFEILGLSSEVVDTCFYGSVSRIEGIGFDGIAEEVLVRHKSSIEPIMQGRKQLPEGGVFQWKQRGEYHLFNPKTIHLLQYSSATGEYPTYKKYAEAINDQSAQACTLRGLLDFRKGEAIPIDEVEPVEEIMKRFSTGAMSFGSISYEAHTTLAIAMNRIGAKSNSGEGGEDAIRYEAHENGDSLRSAIKQVASGRFGVTAHYLANADEIQIKMAQGAKPGEGGQLPGHKVDDWIAKVRHSTPGVGLISPPPHHDIYSIEDLAQLIFDLKNANREARINVKLVSKAGVGIIASGVAKAHADAILISGHDGGTGASPLTSVRHAGLPWELGLAEAHQTLVKNRLRDRVVLQTDGQIRTGQDLAIATLLGAEEWGVATAALVVEGCIMMRKCHMNTCPVGIATQDPDLRKRFTGKVENVIHFFRFLATDLREIMASLGFRTVNEMVGKVEMLKVKKGIQHWKYKQLDLRPILYKEPTDEHIPQFKQVEQDHGIDNILDWQLIEKAKAALSTQKRIKAGFKIKNTDRATGTMLSYEIARKYGAEGLPDSTIQYRFTGSAGQSFCAFAAKGLDFTLEGEANDYFGKGLSGATLTVFPDQAASFDPSENIIIGNVALYGATSGSVFVHGRAGERFAVRNSGVNAVIEGIGDHGCEYMTGGQVIILGQTGTNFAAGMSGGVAFVYNPERDFLQKCNLDSVDLEWPSTEDYETLKYWIESHQKKTGSQKAENILEDWENTKEYFIKVMPKEYKKALEAKERQTSDKVPVHTR